MQEDQNHIFKFKFKFKFKLTSMQENQEDRKMEGSR